jgi:hypothetical protein
LQEYLAISTCSTLCEYDSRTVEQDTAPVLFKNVNE